MEGATGSIVGAADFLAPELVETYYKARAGHVGILPDREGCNH